MKKNTLRGLLALFLWIPCVAFSADSSDRELIVKFKSRPSRLDAVNLLTDFSAQIQTVKPALSAEQGDAFGLDKIYIYTFKSAEMTTAALSELKWNSRIEYAETRVIRSLDVFKTQQSQTRQSLDGVPNDPFYAQQWGLQTIEAEAAWNLINGHPNVAVAVVDVGVDFTHPELAPARWQNQIELSGQSGVDDDNNGFIDDFYGYDFVQNDGDPSPENFTDSHGTHVAGIAAAVRNNNRGIASIASGCKIMAIRAGTSSSIPYGQEGIYYACRAGAKVINCSWGGPGESAFERDMMNYVLAQGCVVVVSAGNGNTDEPHYPAALEGALSVSATGLGDYAADFTHYGPWVKISAPGVAILSTVPPQNGIPRYDTWQGTSMAAPLVAGVCALVASKFPDMSGRQISQRVISSSNPIDNLNPLKAGGLGLGRVNAYRALADSVSGVRLEDITFTEQNGNGNARVEPGETALLSIAIYNDASQVNGVYTQIATTADTLDLQNVISYFGNLQTGGPYYNSIPPLTIALPLESLADRIIPLTLDFFRFDGRLIGRAVKNIFLNPPYVAVSNGYLTLGFSQNGSLGFNDYVRDIYIGTGLKISAEPLNALYHGSFLFASNGDVSDNFYGNTQRNKFDWQPVEGSHAELISNSLRADVEASASFDDYSADAPLFVEVKNTALAWTDPLLSKGIILEYMIINRSINTLSNCYAGFLMDWDIGAARSNHAYYNSDEDIAFVSSDVVGYPLAGVASITSPFTAFTALNNRTEIDAPADFGDSRKWQLLNSGLQTPADTAMDLSELTAYGPFTLASYETLTVAYALVTGSSAEELNQVAAVLRQEYGTAFTSPRHSPSIAKVTAGLFPNPLPSGSELSLNTNAEGKINLAIYNILGQQIASYQNIQTQNGSIKLNRTLLGNASGLLLYRIEGNAFKTQGKLLVLK